MGNSGRKGDEGLRCGGEMPVRLGGALPPTCEDGVAPVRREHPAEGRGAVAAEERRDRQDLERGGEARGVQECDRGAIRELSAMQSLLPPHLSSPPRRRNLVGSAPRTIAVDVHRRVSAVRLDGSRRRRRRRRPLVDSVP